MCRTGCLFIGFFLITAVGVSAGDDYSGRHRFTVWDIDGNRIDIRRGILDQQGISGIRRDRTPITVSYDQISRARIYRGNYAVIGGVIGLCAGIAAVMEIRSGSEGLGEIPLTEIGVVVISVSTAAGLFIGNAFPKWQEIPVETVWPRSSSPSPGLTISLRF